MQSSTARSGKHIFSWFLKKQTNHRSRCFVSSLSLCDFRDKNVFENEDFTVFLNCSQCTCADGHAAQNKDTKN